MENNELAKKGKVRVGMSDDQCRTAWGRPDHINRSEDTRGVHEQWVYDDAHYLFLEDGFLESIQGIGRPDSAPAEVTPSVRYVAAATATPTAKPLRDPDTVTITKTNLHCGAVWQRECFGGSKAPLRFARGRQGSRPLLRRRGLRHPNLGH